MPVLTDIPFSLDTSSLMTRLRVAPESEDARALDELVRRAEKIGNPKAVRDATDVGSSLLGQLATLQWWPKFLVPLAFLGIASFMTGIALEFASIPGILDRRIAVLKQAIPLMAGK